jgi:hypothetical protein
MLQPSTSTKEVARLHCNVSTESATVPQSVGEENRINSTFTAIKQDANSSFICPER